MIKKVIPWLFIWLFALIWFTFWANYEQDFTVWINKYWSNKNSNYEIWALPKWRFITNYLWDSKAVFWYDNNILIFWDLNQKLYMFNNGWQWEFTKFRVCENADFENWPVGCGWVEDVTDNSNGVIWNFLKWLNSNDIVYFQDNYQSRTSWSITYWCHVVQMCFSLNTWSSLCYLATAHSHSTTDTSSCWINAPWSPSNWYTVYWLNNIYWLSNDTTFISLNRNYIWESPAFDYNFNPDTEINFSTWSNSVTIDNTYDKDIRYFEITRNYSPTMCYVGTNDLTSLFGTNWVTYTEGGGDTVFGLYYSMYSGFWENRIKNVWSFINTWLQNYNTWLNPSGLRDYVAVYNWPDQNVTYLRTWVTHPFLDKPAALYFFFNVLWSDYVNENSPWESIAYYCDLVLNYHSYEDWSLDFGATYDLVDDKVKERINDYTQYHFWSNDNNWSYSVPNLTGWSIWWNLVKTWYNIPNDVNPTSLFKDFYDKIISLSDFYNPVTRTWIIPRWIIYPMLFLILFRILRH